MLVSSFAFEAKHVALGCPDDDFHLVGFADSEADTVNYLMLQRARRFDEQDVALGLDTYHVEWCGQSRSVYGGVIRFSLWPGRAEVVFSQNAAKALGGLQSLAISFQLTLIEQLELRGALGRIFEGSDCLALGDEDDCLLPLIPMRQ